MNDTKRPAWTLNPDAPIILAAEELLPPQVPAAGDTEQFIAEANIPEITPEMDDTERYALLDKIINDSVTHVIYRQYKGALVLLTQVPDVNVSETIRLIKFKSDLAAKKYDTRLVSCFGELMGMLRGMTLQTTLSFPMFSKRNIEPSYKAA